MERRVRHLLDEMDCISNISPLPEMGLLPNRAACPNCPNARACCNRSHNALRLPLLFRRVPCTMAMKLRL